MGQKNKSLLVRHILCITLLHTINIHTSEQQSKKNAQMIVFIHGSMQPAAWYISDLIKVIRNQLEKSIYLKTAQYLRQDPYFHHYQAMQAEGLLPINMHDEKNASTIIARMCEAQFEWLENNTPRLYYTFGWTGIINVFKRYQDAQKLYAALTSELEKLNKQGIYPTIQLVCYSHGGNVALNLAAVKDDNPEKNRLTIDELIMFGTPIQRVTDYLTIDSMFKKIYHFYSFNDSVQTLDFTSPKQFFSKRKFKKRYDFTPPSSLIQICLKTTKELIRKRPSKDIEHVDYTFLNDHRFKHIYDDPKHTEFWNFAWGSTRYRRSFAITPLPIVVFFPSLLAGIQKANFTNHDLIFDFAPEYEGAAITDKKTKKCQTIQLISKDHLDHLYTLAKASERTECDMIEQQAHFNDAMEKAKTDFEKEHNEKIKKKNTLKIAYFMP